MRELRDGRSNAVQSMMHREIGHCKAQLKASFLLSLARRRATLEMGPHRFRRNDILPVFRPRPAECTHTCGGRVKGDPLPSVGPVWMTYGWLCLSTCYCCAARPATTITTTLTRNAGSSDCGAHHDLTCATSQQSHQFHSKPTANTKSDTTPNTPTISIAVSPTCGNCTMATICGGEPKRPNEKWTASARD